MRLSFTAAVVAVGLCLLVAGVALAAESTVYWRADLHQGTSIIAYGQGATEEAAKLDCYRLQAITRAMTAAETRKAAVAAVTTQAVRWCNNARRYSTVTPDPVVPVRQAVLSWTPRLQNNDGSPLTDLAGYRIHYGASPDAMTQTIQVANPGISSYTVSNLAPGTYYFAIRAYAADGDQSDPPSNIVSKIVL
jgi:hypothetical protein